MIGNNNVNNNAWLVEKQSENRVFCFIKDNLINSEGLLLICLAEKEGCNPETADGINCPTYNFLVPLFLAIYMLIVVILLVNLLIAIFR